MPGDQERIKSEAVERSDQLRSRADRPSGRPCRSDSSVGRTHRSKQGPSQDPFGSVARAIPAGSPGSFSTTQYSRCFETTFSVSALS